MFEPIENQYTWDVPCTGWNTDRIIFVQQMLVLLTVCRYAEYRFVLVEKTKSAKNIWEPVIVKVTILGFLMADTS